MVSDSPFLVEISHVFGMWGEKSAYADCKSRYEMWGMGG